MAYVEKPHFVALNSEEYSRLRSKMYPSIEDDDKGGKTAKGIKKNVIKKYVKHEDYKNIYFLITG